MTAASYRLQRLALVATQRRLVWVGAGSHLSAMGASLAVLAELIADLPAVAVAVLAATSVQALRVLLALEPLAVLAVLAAGRHLRTAVLAALAVTTGLLALQALSRAVALGAMVRLQMTASLGLRDV